VWVDLFGKARRATRLGDRLRVFLRPPGWQPEELGGFEPPPDVDRATYRKFETPLTPRLASYVFVQFTVVLLGTTWLLFHLPQLGLAQQALAALAAVVGLVVMGGLMERKRWASSLEWARLAALPLVCWMVTGGVLAAALAAGGALVSLLWLPSAPARARAEAPTTA